MQGSKDRNGGQQTESETGRAAVLTFEKELMRTLTLVGVIARNRILLYSVGEILVKRVPGELSVGRQSPV